MSDLTDHRNTALQTAADLYRTNWRGDAAADELLIATATAVLGWLTQPVPTIDAAATLARHDTQIHLLRRQIMATAEEFATRLDTASNAIAAEIRQVRDELAAALGSVAGSNQAAVDAALAKLDGPISRVEALGTDPANPVPAPTSDPAQPVPPAPEPAPATDPNAPAPVDPNAPPAV